MNSAVRDRTAREGNAKRVSVILFKGGCIMLFPI